MRLVQSLLVALFIGGTALADAFTWSANQATVRPPTGDGNLYHDGEIGEFIRIAQSGAHQFTVRARGTQAMGEWPIMALGVDGMERTRITVANSSFANYSITLNLEAGVHYLSAALRNHATDGQASRDLYLDTFTLTPPSGAGSPSKASAGIWIQDAQIREEAALAMAEAAIPVNRMSDVEVLVHDGAGNPIPGATVRVEQTRHEFLFGANAAAWSAFDTPAKNAAYTEHFEAIFNYATVTLYWSLLEPAPGVRHYDRTDGTVAWAVDNDIAIKGHPLLWADPASIPGWMESAPSQEAQRNHLDELVARYKESIRYWEVVNEPANVPGIPLDPPHQWAREADPDGVLIVNEYGILATGHEQFFGILESAVAAGTSFDAIGIQAHAPEDMAFHLGRVWEVLDHYATLGKDLHITEFTPPADGRAVSGTVWRGNWDEATQAEYAEKFYRVCFAHPAVKAISWWDFADEFSWLPGGGLLNSNLEPKPAYNALYKLIREEWWTDEEVQTGENGMGSLRAFHGSHRVTVQFGDEDSEATIEVRPGEKAQLIVTLAVEKGPPPVAVVTVPEYSTASPLQVSYSVTHGDGTEFGSARLWVRANGGDWMYTGLSSSFESDTFSVPAPADGIYAFAVQTVNPQGTAAPVPTGDGVQTTLDTTPPSTGSLSGPSATNQTTVSLNYSGATDALSGLAHVELWARKPGGSWAATGLGSETESGVFAYTSLDSPGDYTFALRVRDKAGNTTPVPSGDGQWSLFFNNIPPAIHQVFAPVRTNSLPIAVEYAGDASIQTAELWIRSGGSWQSTGITRNQPAGVFSLESIGAEGVYGFAVRATDALGNVSAIPQGSPVAETTYDVTPPHPGTVTAPGSVNATAFSVQYSGAHDHGGSGIESVELWVSKDGGPWSATGHVRNTASGSFSFEATAGDGVYAFGLRARDRAGNESAAPAGPGLASTTVSTEFTPGTLTAPQYATETPIVLSYAGAHVGGQDSPVLVHLWVKRGEQGVWEETGMTQLGNEGQFEFSAVSGDGEYFFSLQAENEAMERTQAPAALGQDSTVYDTEAPKGSIESPATANKLPISLDYTATDGEGSGVAEVRIWVKRGVDGEWEDTGLVLTAESGQVEFDAIQEEGDYFFVIQVTDRAGLQSPTPSDSMIQHLLANAN
jgi:endo-1,4-beta-xylanase